MIDGFLTMSGTVTPRTVSSTRDQHGNRDRVDGTPRPVGCYVEQTDATEITVDRETYTANALGFLPAGDPIGPADRLTVDGRTYEVIGPADPVFNPRTASEHHVEVNLRTVTG